MSQKLNKVPSVLAFSRKLEISDAFFTQQKGFHPQKEIPIVVRAKTVRGTISNRLKKETSNDPVKLDAEVKKPNLQTVDFATLDEDKDTLVVRFTLKVLPFTGLPMGCNDPDYQKRVLEIFDKYVKEQGLSLLAERYAANIANARWLWRNRLNAESIQVTVRNNNIQDEQENTVTIKDAKALSLNSFKELPNDVKKIAAWIEQGFQGEFTLLEISAYLNMGWGQEVFPSEEFIQDKGQSNKSKELYTINGKAGMHSQKVGNAIRTIDTWYSDTEQFPIAIEPYGSVTTLGTAFRQPRTRRDFYTLCDGWVLKDKEPEPKQQHYLAAVLIRGGVFGETEKAKKTKDKNKD